MELGLRDRVAIVTGASRGIGRQIALDLAREGAHLVLNARNPAALESTAHECEAHGVRVVQVVADLLDHDAAPLVAERAVEELGRIDILVNNAGGGGGERIDAAGVQHEVRALAREVERDLLADAAARPGDDRDAVV